MLLILVEMHPWDWNELLTTIENNFESDFDLDALKTDIGNNQTNIATNATGITANLEKNNVQEVQIATLNTNVDKALSDIVTLTAKVAGICLCLPECPACGKKAK